MTKQEQYKGKYARVPMPYGCLYLDQAGTKSVTQDMRFVLVMADGTRKVRLADYWSSLGNFGTVGYRYRGKRYESYPKAHDGGETRDSSVTGIDALPHVFHVNSNAE